MSWSLASCCNRRFNCPASDGGRVRCQLTSAPSRLSRRTPLVRLNATASHPRYRRGSPGATMHDSRPNTRTAEVVEDALILMRYSSRYHAAHFINEYGIALRVIVRVLAPGCRVRPLPVIPLYLKMVGLERERDFLPSPNPDERSPE